VREILNEKLIISKIHNIIRGKNLKKAVDGAQEDIKTCVSGIESPLLHYSEK